jgi:hypothetical protein
MSMPTQCTHVRVNGYRCGSVAMKGQNLCYFHARMRRRAKAGVNTAFAQVLLLEDAESIQASLMQLVDLLLAEQIDARRARVIVSALTLASHNVKNLSIDDRLQEGNNDFDRERARVTPKEEPETEHETQKLPEPLLVTAEEMSKWDRRPCKIQTKCHYREAKVGNGYGGLRDAFQTILTANANIKANSPNLTRAQLDEAWTGSERSGQDAAVTGSTVASASTSAAEAATAIATAVEGS